MGNTNHYAAIMRENLDGLQGNICGDCGGILAY